MAVGVGHWNILGTVFHCAGAPPGARRDLGALLAGFEAHGPPAHREVEFEVVEAGGAAALVLTADGATRRLPLATTSGPDLEFLLVSEALSGVGDRLILHAGAVAGPRGTCVITGPSGAGKTTLSLTLWSRGLSLLGDDVCPIGLDSLLPEVFPRALNLDQSYPDRLLASLPPRPPAYPARRFPFPGTVDLKPPAVTSVLFLERRARGAAELIAVERSEAAQRITAAAIRCRPLAFDRIVRAAASLASAVAAFRLQASTAEAATAAAIDYLGC